MRGTPAAASRSISAARTSGGSTAGSFWSPSRGPTSQTVTFTPRSYAASDVLHLHLVEVLDLHGRGIDARSPHRLLQLLVIGERLGHVGRIEGMRDDDAVSVLRVAQDLLEAHAPH